MDIFTHFIIGILLSVYTLQSMPFSLVVYAAAMSVIADFDIFLEPLKRIKKSHFLSHKGLSHSYITGFMFSFFTAIIFTLITNESLLVAWIVGFLFYSLHVTLDLICASKIPIFYPLSKKKYRFFIDRAINIVLAAISGILILLYLLFFYLLPEIYFSNLFHYISGFYLFYFSYRLFSKIWIQLNLSKDSLYIPGIFPLVYYIYTHTSLEDKQIYKLTKKIQFKNNNNLILKTEIINDSEDMKFYEKAYELAKNYTFFTKWHAIIPIIDKNTDSYSINLILAESYFSKSVYSLNVTFNRNLNTLKAITNGFSLLRKPKHN